MAAPAITNPSVDLVFKTTVPNRTTMAAHNHSSTKLEFQAAKPVSFHSNPRRR
jgi:hypothetical protein